MKKRIPNSYSTFPSNVNMRYGNYMSNGGTMNQLTEFNEGGRHEENGLGGIPQGMNPDGQMNLVEEGETKFDAENYIFSDTLKVDKELAKAFNLSPKMIGKTFADASKMAGRKNSRREGDKIEEAANNADLMNLMEAQEAFKQKEIEEKLAEIDALDPNVLPAMMGQGDPAMGGQMQEASMMDQEAMMAQQSEPSPEEMAMMQNEMMGQQEGMMRSGGKIPKSVLLSRAKSHMSDAAAQEYVKNYGGGGYMKRSYAPGGFMGMNMANAGMMNTGAMGATGTSGCICMDGSTNPQCCGQGYDVTNPGVRPKREARIDNSFWDYENVDRQGDPVLTKGEADFQGSFGPFTRNRRMPGRHRRALEKYDVNYAQTNPGTARGMKDNPAFMTNTPPNMPANFANIDMSQYTPEQQEIINRKSKLLAMEGGERSFEQLYPGLLTKQDRKQIGKVRNALNWEPQQIPLGYDVVKKDRPSEESPGSLDDNTYNRRQEGPKMGTSYPINQSNKFTWFSKNIGQHFKGQTQKQRYSPKLFQSRRIKGMQFGGNLLDGGLAQQEFNLNQGLNSQMRRGGKLCYGCGGAMHAYGGRMSVPGIQHKSGAFMQTTGKALQTAGSFIPVVGSAFTGIGAGLEEAGKQREEGVSTNWKDIAAKSAIGAAGGLIPGVGGTVAGIAEGIYDQTLDSSKNERAEIEKILNDPTHPRHEEFVKGEQQRIEDNKLTKFVDPILNVASTFINPGEATEEVAGDIMDSSIDTIDTIGVDNLPELNIARYGRKLGKGGGLWANIHAKRERIAAGSGERMRKPGSKGAPTAEALRNSQNAMGGHLYYPGGYLFGPAGEMPSTPIPDPIEKQDNTYGSDMPSSFIDMSTGTNPLGLVSPIYNLGMGLFGKESNLSYPLEKFTYKPFDFTESKNALRRQAAKAMDSLRKTGNNNPSNILALKNLNAQTEAAYLERAENINAQREQAAADNNTKLMNKYNKELRELKLKNEAIKDEFIKAGLQDLVGFTEQERQNEYMFNFLKTMAPNVVTGSYNSIFDIFNRKDKKR